MARYEENKILSPTNYRATKAITHLIAKSYTLINAVGIERDLASTKHKTIDYVYNCH
jgi:hypothetical protein